MITEEQAASGLKCCPFCGNTKLKFSLRMPDFSDLYVQGHIRCDKCFVRPSYVGSLVVGNWEPYYVDGNYEGNRITRYRTDEEAVDQLVRDMSARWNKRHEENLNPRTT
jgi:hypothetical protein